MPFLDHNGIMRIKGRLQESITHSFEQKHPAILPQLYSIQSTIENSQNYFYALELNNGQNPMSKGLTNNLRQFDLEVAESHGELRWIASTISLENNIIRDSLSYKGPRVLTFSPPSPRILIFSCSSFVSSSLLSPLVPLFFSLLLVLLLLNFVR